MSRRQSKVDYDVTTYGAVQPGHVVLINGTWREVVQTEPHELDAYIVLFTKDARRFVRGLFETAMVR